MSLDKTTIDIIRYLASVYEPVSSYEISENVGVSRRQIRDKMKHVKRALDDLGYTLESYVAKGYMMPFDNNSERTSLDSKLVELEKTTRPLLPQNYTERIDYIIYRLMTQTGYIKIDTLAEQLSVSRSTISNDLKQLKNNYSNQVFVNIIHKPHHGIAFDMSEPDVRLLYSDTLFRQFSSEQNFYDYIGMSIFNDSQLGYKILTIIDDHFGLSDIGFQDFLLYITVACQRVFHGYTLTQSKDVSAYEDRIEFKLSKEIAVLIKNHLDIDLNTFEITQLGIELMSRRASFSRTLDSNAQYYPIIDAIYKNIEDKLVIDFSQNHGVRELLSAYLPTLFFRLEYKTKLRTPHYLSIQSKYPLAYECARVAIDYLNTTFNYTISRSEFVHLSVFFQTALMELGHYKKRVYVICGMGRGSTEMLRHQLHMWFGNEIEIVRIVQYYVFKKEDLATIDFIITMAPIHDELHIPVLTISQMYDNQDRQKIRTFIDTHYNLPSVKTIFTPSLYFTDIKASTKPSLIKALVKKVNTAFHEVEPALFSSIMDDENRRSVYEYPNGVTIVKFNFSISSGPLACVFHLRKPIQWHSFKAKTLIFISSRSSSDLETQALRHVLSRLSKHTEAKDPLYSLSYPDFIQKLSRYENKVKHDKKITYEVIP